LAILILKLFDLKSFMSNLQSLAAAAGLGGASRDTLGEEMKQCNDSLEALLSSYEAILAHSR